MSEKRVVETTLRVRYAETDAMGIVYHANYIVWFEVGRGEYMRRMGGNYAEWEAQGIFLPVAEVWARFPAPARYGDVVKVRTWVEEVRSRGVTFGYEVAKDDQILTTGWTKHVCVDAEGRVRTLPPRLREMLGGEG